MLGHPQEIPLDTYLHSLRSREFIDTSGNWLDLPVDCSRKAQDRCGAATGASDAVCYWLSSSSPLGCHGRGPVRGDSHAGRNVVDKVKEARCMLHRHVRVFTQQTQSQVLQRCYREYRPGCAAVYTARPLGLPATGKSTRQRKPAPIAPQHPHK